MYLGKYFLNKVYRSFILIALVHFKANFSQKTEEKGDFQCQNWNWKIQSCTHTFQTYLLSTYYILYIPSKVFFPCYYLCVTYWSLRGQTICTVEPEGQNWKQIAELVGKLGYIFPFPVHFRSQDFILYLHRYFQNGQLNWISLIST